MRVKCHRSGWNVIQKLQNRWETNLSIVRLVKNELNSVFKRFLIILGTDWVGPWVKKFTQPLNEEFACCLK